jgi:hypothetical protein
VASDFLDGAELTDPNQAFAATSGLADHVTGLMALAAE